MNCINKIREGYSKLASKKFFYPLVSIPWIIYIFLLTKHLLNRGLIEFQYNDDFYISLIVGGGFGSPSPYTIYTNIIMGKILSTLTVLSPAHNWFMLIQLAALVFSYMAFGVWSILRNKPLIGYLSSAVFVLATVNSVLCKVSYTKTGALVISVGLILLTSSLLSKDWKSLSNRLLRILSYLIIIAGALFRKEIGLTILPFAVLMTILIAKECKEDRLKKLISFWCVFLIILLSWIGHQVIYSIDSDWKYFTEYNKVRTELLDYGMPNYDDYTNDLAELGFSRVDFLTLSSYRFSDNEVFSIEALQKIIDFRDSLNTDVTISEKVENTFKELIVVSKKYVVFYIMIIFFLAMLSISSGEMFFYQVCSAVFGIGEIWLMIYRGRLLEHVFYLAIIYGFVSVVLFYSVRNTEKKRGLRGAVLLILVCLLTYYSCDYYSLKDRIGAWTQDYATFDSVFEYTRTTEGKLFVLDITDDYNLLTSGFNSFGHFSEIPHDNVVVMGSWFVPSPLQTTIIANYGDRYNLFKLMATSEDVYWISPINSNRSIFLEYIQQHYNPDADIYIVDDLGDYYVISFLPFDE